ncbi:hypothetical protein H4Q32_028127 [Labeo rohita]|uniref:DUF4806 domain-containing protein n=1 Tax=Labeo rohita TaxID=84645 RepID=A0ABQ8MJP8_LABRO|nr:hypothetical protein H4Q32_028127 [Labeo rohita]
MKSNLLRTIPLIKKFHPLAHHPPHYGPGTAGPPQLPPPPAPALNMRRTEEPCSSLTYRPTWRGGRMTDTIPCSAAEVHILSLLETIKQQQDQLVAKVNYLSSRLNSTPGPDVEMPNNIHFPLENLEAVEAFEMFLKEPSNGPARQKVISSLATIGGQDVKRVTWNILGRLFTDEVSHQINWKGVNNKKPFSRMATKTLLFSKYIIQISHGGGGHQARNQVVQPGDGSGNEETCPASIHTNGYRSLAGVDECLCSPERSLASPTLNIMLDKRHWSEALRSCEEQTTFKRML